MEKNVLFLKTKQMFKKKITIFYIASAIFILDRLSKYFILELSNSEDSFNIPITSFLNFNLVWNSGIAFGLFSFNEQFYYNIITLIIIIITFVILLFAIKSNGLEKIGFSMIFGGSLGNIFDRLYYTAVVDFIDITTFYLAFPVREIRINFFNNFKCCFNFNNMTLTIIK